MSGFRYIIILLIILMTMPLLAQAADSLKSSSPPVPEYLLATQMGKDDARGNVLYFFAGAGLGVYGIILAAISYPDPDPVVMGRLVTEHDQNFAMIYASSYSNSARKKNLAFAGMGSLFVISAIIAISIKASSEVGDKSFLPGIEPDLNPSRLIPVFSVPTP